MPRRSQNRLCIAQERRKIYCPEVNPEVFNCPTCGAAASSFDAKQCAYCGSRLATIQCASCFGMLFVGSKFCPHCGAAAAAKQAVTERKLSCPRCASENRATVMECSMLNTTHLHECPHCDGIWINHPTFRLICTRADIRDEAMKMLGVSKGSTERTIRYLRCPVCDDQMARRNYTGRSGVIMDFCNTHGLWFDRDELRHVIEFIRSGGLEDAARVKTQRLMIDRQSKADEERLLGGSPWPDEEPPVPIAVTLSTAHLIGVLVNTLRGRRR
jgi:Zn-finger nucleic acid-binding protein